MNSPSEFDLAAFRSLPLIAILRQQPSAAIPAIIQAIAEGGFRAVEITMNSIDATDQIRTAVAHAPKKVVIGAGTVTTLAELDQAEAAGAGFIVTPVVNPVVITECVSRGLPVFPGAFTPTEVHTAHQSGATMVKLFPAHRLGPGYLKDLKAPLSSVPLLATGGITPENMPGYIQAGADGFGIGSPLLSTARIVAQDWNWLRHRAAEFCAVWSTAFPDNR